MSAPARVTPSVTETTSKVPRGTLYRGREGMWSWVLHRALATAGVALHPGRVGVSFGPVTVVADGRSASHDERAAAAVAAKSQVDLAVDLGIGPAAATVTTTDLPPEALGRHGG